jgi:hypothetical protein
MKLRIQIALIVSLSASPAFAASLAESLDPVVRKDVYSGLSGCAAYYDVMAEYPKFSPDTAKDNAAKGGKFLAAAVLFHETKDLTKTTGDYRISREKFVAAAKDTSADPKQVLSYFRESCGTIEEYADAALAETYSLMGTAGK